MTPRKRPDYSRPLPRPLVIPSVMRLKTLADVRKLIGRMPMDFRAKETWQRIAALVDDAARGDTDPTRRSRGIAASFDDGKCRGSTSKQKARPTLGQPGKFGRKQRSPIPQPRRRARNLILDCRATNKLMPAKPVMQGLDALNVHARAPRAW